MTLGRTNRANDTLTYTSQHRILSGTTHQLADIGANGHTSLGNQLDTILCNSRYWRGIYHFRVHRHLYSLKHITSGQVDSRSHLEGQLHIGLRCTNQRMYNTLNMTTGQIVCLQSVTRHVGQTGLVCLDQTVHNLCGRHLTDAH